MGREVRKVRPDWQHPEDGFYGDGQKRYHSLYAGPYSKAASDWDIENAEWDKGNQLDYSTYPTLSFKPKEGSALESTFEDWNGERPEPEDYMPEWSEAEATHFMMYETCTEGSPISPAFATIEELARWLADNNASAFGSETATYEQWLRMCGLGWAPSAMSVGGNLTSGVAAI